MSKVSQKLKSAKFPFKDVSISLDRALGAERDELLQARPPLAARAAAVVEEKAPDARLGGPSVAKELQKLDKKIADVETAMRDSAITLRITGVSFGTYNEYIAANPPREGKQEQFNSSTFYIYVARRTAQSLEDDGTLEPVTDTEWDDIEANLTDGEHDRIAMAVVAVNRTEGLRGVDFLSNISGATPSS